MRWHRGAKPGPARPGRARDARRARPALLLGLGVVLLVATADVGLFAYANLAAPHIADDVARAAVIDPGAADADARILAAVKAQAAGLHGARIERVVVYRATAADAPPPAACLHGPAADAPEDDCSVYGPDDLDRPATDLRCRWCPQERCAGTHVGVAIRLGYRPLGVTGPTVGLTEHAVYTVIGPTTSA